MKQILQSLKTGVTEVADIPGLGAPLRRWLRHELRPRVEDTLDPAASRRRGFFDPRLVRALIDDDRDGRIDGSYTIFALMCFELWCCQFVDV